MGTFGNTNIESLEVTNSADENWAIRFQMNNENGQVTKITLYGRTLSGTSNARCAIYSDNNGAPNSLLGTTNQVTVNTNLQWRDFPFATTVPVTANTWYWLAMNNSAGMKVRSGATSTPGRYKTDAYGDGFDNPWGSGTSYNYIVSIYATHTPAVTAQTVSDGLSLTETVFRDKTVSIADSAGLQDFPSGNKNLVLVDSLSSEDLMQTLKALNIVDASTLIDEMFTPSRIIRINEAVSLAEVAYVGDGGIKKTKLFLVLGGLALQISGD